MTGLVSKSTETSPTITKSQKTGAKGYGEFLVNAQGEDVVAGVRTPRQIAELKEAMPESYRELERTCKILERHYKEMQDIEFTIENGKLWLLQTRTGKRTGFAAVRIAVDMVDEKIHVARRVAGRRLRHAGKP